MARTRALEGLRVVELGTLIGAPFCATLMAEFGADVIKVEDPKVGDSARSLGQALDETGLFFVHVARNKRCVTLDLRRPEGQAVVKRLVAMSDVVVENFRPGTLAAWGLDYSTLAAVNPRIIVAHVSGFGQYGPYAQRAAFDRIATAFAGQDYITGFPDRPPTRPAGALADYITALYCTIGVMFAIYHRDVGGGTGQEIDLALYEGLFRIIPQIEEFAAFGMVPERMGNTNPLIAPAETFRTADGRWIAIHAGTDNVWKRFLDVLGRPDLDGDPRFRTPRSRAQNAAALHAIIATWVEQRPAAGVLATLEAAGVPSSRINSVEDVFTDPHIRARDNIVEARLSSGTSIATVGVVPKLSVTPGRIDTLAPPLGAHNEEIYRGLLGMTAAEYDDLVHRGIV